MAKKDKRRQIMQAAEKLFTSRRFHEITLDEVAEAAKVGKGTIYLHFKDKEDLFFQTALAGFDDLCELLNHKVPSTAPFEDQLSAAATEISKFFQRRRQALRMAQSEDARMPWVGGNRGEEWLAKRRQVVTVVADIMRLGVREGKVREDISPQVLANFLLAQLKMFGFYLAHEPKAEEHIGLLIDLFIRGAGRSGDGEPLAARITERLTDLDSV